jgi:hypothetical protein
MKRPFPASAKQAGFTLIITISLLVLLTLVAIGLLSLSSVSLRSASRGDAAQVARANARMALLMAIGQLQKEMGPDSRISAPQDAGTPTGGSPRYVGVYDAWRSPANGATPLTPASRVQNLRTWLVSGAAGATVPTSPLVPLVGARSLGANAAAVNLVSAPMVNVADATKSGKIAWWIADESAKAKINAGAATENFATATRPMFDAQSPRFVGAQAVPELSGFEWTARQRASVVSTDTTNLAANLTSPGIGNLSHDVTVHSQGVLTDVREGRLKRDLTNLLLRPIAEAEDKPFYLADGRINRFVIGANGSVTNASYIPANARANGLSLSFNNRNANEWGINLEELHLFHNLHREIEWSGNTPKIVSKNNRVAAINDRYFLYRQPTIEAAQFILSLRAVPSGTGTFRMEMMLDGMVAVANPNDVTFEYAPGLQLALQLLRIPYRLTWDIRRNGAPFNTTTPPNQAGSFEFFRGYVGGGPAAASALGFSLQPGEAGVFGSTTGTGVVLSLQRGFVPSGGILMSEYNLSAANLLPSDVINFRMDRVNTTQVNNKYSGAEFGGNVWSYNNYWIGVRNNEGIAGGLHMGAMVTYNSPPDTADVNSRLPIVIQPSQARPVSDFVSRPQPFMAFSFIRNVEQDSNPASPEAFASRSHLMSEPASGLMGQPLDSIGAGLQVSQFTLKAEPLPYQFRTLAAGAGGRNIYHGGSRQPNLGGSFNVIKRRIPLAPPLSIGAFENAIASGFSRRFRDALPINGDTIPSSARALNGEAAATPVVTKAIGNSYASPFLPVNSVYSMPPNGVFNAGSPPAGGTDHSWMINNVLWDSWFLSGIVDGRSLGSNPFQTDGRSQRAQFNDLVRGTGLLRNQRYVFFPFRPADTALQELFNGESLRPSAINDLSRYLMIDGAFNVNCTSATAWKALLSSVRNQELLVQGGGRKQFTNPYGTLGYAQTDATTNDWTGLRDLSESELDALSRTIVEEVKARGPFLNMADFVNRRPNSAVPAHRSVGALQAAIDRAGLNNRYTGGARSVNAASFSGLPGASAVTAETVPARSAGSAGHLTQARLLTAIGSQISVRGDTFLIRTYGDARDPSENVLARAWCEAVVQRTPAYVDATDLPEAADGWPASTNRLRPINALLGRRMEIRSFRWLSSDEI